MHQVKCMWAQRNKIWKDATSKVASFFYILQSIAYFFYICSQAVMMGDWSIYHSITMYQIVILTQFYIPSKIRMCAKKQNLKGCNIKASHHSLSAASIRIIWYAVFLAQCRLLTIFFYTFTIIKNINFIENELL